MENKEIIDYGLSTAIAIIMVGMGLSLRISDFLRMKENPKPVLIGLVNQLIL